MGMQRRRFLLAALTGLASSAHAITTPRQSTGPFYPDVMPEDDDSDLTRVHGAAAVAKGEISDLRGRVLDTNGKAISGARVEIWQCDANGRYIHTGDYGGAPRDPGFQGFGKSQTNGNGEYRFRTIRPVSYPGRTPHIHIAVHTGRGSPFVTQIYLKGEAQNTRDFLFNRAPDSAQHLLLADFRPSNTEGVQFDAKFDIILAGENGTPRS